MVKIMQLGSTARLRAILLGAALGAALLGAGTASASIVYQVDESIGLGSVRGTLTTDGATGVLAASDILAWDLVLQGVGAFYHLASSTADANKYVIGNDLTATPSYIYFNFSGTVGDQFLLQDGPENGTTYWCNSVGDSSCRPGKSVVPVYVFYSSSQFDPTASGNQIIATASVPEPSTWALMLVGFAALGYGAYRQTAKARLAA
jgi:hypothetical protein